MTLPLNLTVWPSHKDGVLLELARETSVRQEDGAGCTLQPGTGAWAFADVLQGGVCKTIGLAWGHHYHRNFGYVLY